MSETKPESNLEIDSQEKSRNQPESEKNQKLSSEEIQDLVFELKTLDTERAELGYFLYNLTGKTQAEREGKTKEGQFMLDLEEESEAESESEDILKLHKTPELKDIKNVAIKKLAESAEKRQQKINQRIEQLVSNKQVMSAYQKYRESRIVTIKKAREAAKLEATQNVLDIEEAETIKSITSSSNYPIQEQLDEIKSKRQQIQERLAELQEDPEVAAEIRVRQLLEYKRQMEKFGFAETPSRKAYMQEIMDRWQQGSHVMLTGPTGTGKTELFRQIGRKFWDHDLSRTLVSGTGDVTSYTLFGKPKGMEKTESGGLDIITAPGKVSYAMEHGEPVIFDEFNAIETNTRLRLKALYNYKPGEVYYAQEDSGEDIDIHYGYHIGATANIKGEKHKERFDLDQAENRVFKQIYVEYLPQEELFDVCLAEMIDSRGRLNLGIQDIEALQRLVAAATWIQDAYLGKQTQVFEQGQATTGKKGVLKEAVLDPGQVLQILKGFKQSRAKGENFQEFIEKGLIGFINKEGYPEKDRKLMLEGLVRMYGFFPSKKASEFLVNNLTEQELDNWRANQIQL